MYNGVRIFWLIGVVVGLCLVGCNQQQNFRKAAAQPAVTQNEVSQDTSGVKRGNILFSPSSAVLRDSGGMATPVAEPALSSSEVRAQRVWTYTSDIDHDLGWAYTPLSGPDDFLYVAGVGMSRCPTGGTCYRIKKMSKLGIVVGEYTSDPTPGDDNLSPSPHTVAFDEQRISIYLVGIELGGSRWRIEKVRLSDFSRVAEKNIGPTGTSGPVGGTAVAVGGGALYVVGTDNGNIGKQWRVLKLDPNTLEVQRDRLINPSDVVNYNGCEGEIPWDVVYDPAGYIYITGYNAGLGPQGVWRTMKLQATDLSTVWSYDSTPSAGPDVPWGMVFDPRGFLYVAGHDGGGVSTDGRLVGRMRLEKLKTGNNISPDNRLVWRYTHAAVSRAATSNVAAGLTFDPRGEGSVYISGIQDGNFDVRARVEKINAATGRRVWSYTSAREGTPKEEAFGSTFDAEGGVYWVGYDSPDPQRPRWKVEKIAVLSSPANLSVTLLASASEVNLGSVVPLSVQVKNVGEGVSNASLSFLIQKTGGAQELITPQPSVLTNEEGNAVWNFRPTAPGQYQVTAYAQWGVLQASRVLADTIRVVGPPVKIISENGEPALKEGVFFILTPGREYTALVPAIDPSGSAVSYVVNFLQGSNWWQMGGGRAAVNANSQVQTAVLSWGGSSRRGINIREGDYSASFGIVDSSGIAKYASVQVRVRSGTQPSPSPSPSPSPTVTPSPSPSPSPILRRARIFSEDHQPAQEERGVFILNAGVKYYMVIPVSNPVGTSIRFVVNFLRGNNWWQMAAGHAVVNAEQQFQTDFLWWGGSKRAGMNLPAGEYDGSVGIVVPGEAVRYVSVRVRVQ